MPAVTQAAFTKTLSAKKFDRKPCYLIFGPDAKRLAEECNRLKDRLLSVVGEDNYFRYVRLGDGPDEKSGADVVATLNTVSMFGGGNVVWAGPVETLSKADSALFISYATSPNEQSTLILSVAISKERAKQAISTMERSPLYKAFCQSGVAVKIVAPKVGDIQKWAKDRFEAKGVKADPPAIHRLIELSGRDLDQVASDIEKLVSYVGDKQHVSMEDVEETVGDHRHNTLWDLTDSVRAKNKQKAYSALSDLMAQNMPSQVILKMLTTDLARIMAAREVKDSGASFDHYAKKAGGAVYPLQKAWGDAGRWSQSQVREGLLAILSTNLDLIRSGVEPETGIASLIGELCDSPVRK